MADKLINVLIADDSENARELLANIVHSEPRFKIVGMAENGVQAVEMAIRLRPDVIIMDLMMPELNGFEAIQQIMEKAPTKIIAVSGVFNEEEISQGFAALNAGAATIIEKPKWISEQHYFDTSRFIVETIKALGAVKTDASSEEHHDTLPETNVHASIVGIGASLGGPPALFYILSKLPAGYSIPILIYQQIPAKLINGLAAWLNTSTPLKVAIAKNGEKIQPGYIYLAQDESTLQVNQNRTISLTDGKAKYPIDALFKSMAAAYGSQSAAILLKGIGSDGDAGIESLKNEGAFTVIQNSYFHHGSSRDGSNVEALTQSHAQLDEIVHILKQLGNQHTFH